MRRFWCLALGMVLVTGALSPAVAADPGNCDLDPSGVGCSGGGSGGGGGSSTTTTTIPATYHWGGWSGSAISCAADNPRYVRYLLWEDGSLVSPVELVGPPPVGAELGDSYVYQQVCVPVAATAVSVWDALVSDIEELPEPVATTSPSTIGITGLETWFWYEGVTQAGPVAVSWTDGTTGVTFGLEGVAWIGSIEWKTGDGGDLRADALSYASAPAVGGSEADPAATYLYEQTSTDHDFPDGFPLTMTITWVGEWRWRTGGGPWEPWRPMANSLSIVTVRPYPVDQVIGQLDPVG